jgi:hypothetical protein
MHYNYQLTTPMGLPIWEENCTIVLGGWTPLLAATVTSSYARR